MALAQSNLSYLVVFLYTSSIIRNGWPKVWQPKSSTFFSGGGEVMNNSSGISGVRVVGGPQEATAAMEQETVRGHFVGESGDPAQVIERFEEEVRLLEEW